MESRHFAGAIGLIIISAGIVVPVEGQSADLKSLLGGAAKEVMRIEAQKAANSAKRNAATSANSQSATISPNETLRTQQALKDAGFSPGPIDGIDGEQTRAAIRAFQRANGWPATGVLTTAQRRHLFGLGGVGAAGIALGFVPLFDSDGGSATGTAGTVQERNTSTVSTDVGGATTNDLSARRKSRLVTGDGGTDNAVTTETVTEGQNLDTTAGAAQQSLKSLLGTSTQPSDDESATTTERSRVKRRTAASVDSTNETPRTRTGAAVGDASGDNVGRRARTVGGVTTIDCTIASRRAGRCPPTQ